jgi:hypothetical protein
MDNLAKAILALGEAYSLLDQYARERYGEHTPDDVIELGNNLLKGRKLCAKEMGKHGIN